MALNVLTMMQKGTNIVRCKISSLGTMHELLHSPGRIRHHCWMCRLLFDALVLLCSTCHWVPHIPSLLKLTTKVRSPIMSYGCLLRLRCAWMHKLCHVQAQWLVQACWVSMAGGSGSLRRKHGLATRSNSGSC